MFGTKCPCESGESYSKCCEPFHKVQDKPKTAEQLMRARYSAYVKKEINYLRDTLLPRERKSFDPETVKQWAEKSQWNGLEILKTKGGKATDSDGVVEFLAKYTLEGEEQNHHEVATFKRLNGTWFFIDGKIKGTKTIQRENPKIGRNDPCHCGSGKKFKKCCAA